MKKKFLVVASLLALTGAVGVVNAAGPETDQAKIASLVNDMNAIGSTGLDAMKPIQIRRFEVPGPGVDVMRARLQETYSVDGVGKDTVELTGWIAVRHGQARPAAGHTDLNWNTAVLDTEFVAMDLHGESAVFGPVHVTLDKSRPSYGQVGRIEIPELAKVTLLARLEKGEKGEAAGSGAAANDSASGAAEATQDLDGAACAAPVNVSVKMPALNLDMATEHHVYWYSLVDTIPPVGHTASIAIEPVRLITGGRAVATLESGVVNFREVVRHVPLSSATEQVASGQK